MRLTVVKWSRFFWGLLCGPLIALYLIPMGNCALILFAGSSNCWAGIAGFTWYGLPVVGIAIVVALPLILLALRNGWAGIGQYIFSGAVLASVLGGVLGLLDHHLSTVALILGFAPLGAIAAFLVWVIGIRRNTAAIPV